MRKLMVIFYLVLVAGSLGAEVIFGGLDISPSQELLFFADADVPTYDAYRSGFVADLETVTLEQLSFFPESITYLQGSNNLHLQNRYGMYRTSVNLDDPQPVAGFPTFVGGNEIQTGKIASGQPSADGKYLLYFEAVSPAFANLILLEVESGEKTTISTQVEVVLSNEFAKWSPDSSFFVYEKDGKVFYYSTTQHENERVLGEEFRIVGDGGVENCYWGANSELYYISGSLVYQILGVEFFTRSLYQDFIKIGRIAGKLPFVFDPNFDSFWISPDGSQLLLNKNGRNLFLYLLQTNDFSADQSAIVELPYLYLPRNTKVRKVVWAQDNGLTVLTGGIAQGLNSSSIYRLVNDGTNEYSFEQTDDSDVQDIVLSGRGTSVALLRTDGVTLKDYSSWEDRGSIAFQEPLYANFLSEGQLLIAGSYTTEVLTLEDQSRRFLFFSQVESMGFDASSEALVVRSGDRAMEWDRENGIWVSYSGEGLRPAVQNQGQYRAYLENLSSGSYQNMVMVRRLRNSGTDPLFNTPAKQYDPFPDREQANVGGIFNHGSRIRGREIGLVFNGINSVDGLTDILLTLKEYDVKATFFLNGDFIRRHPGAVTEIADGGHEVGSLFNVYFDMADTRFEVTRDFIVQGLARNEDAYFETTGREMSLLWHAPYYYANDVILDAGREMNYTYVGRDVDSLDWVAKRNSRGLNRLYRPSSELIESIIEAKQPGSIISMTIGRPGDDRPDGGRDDYLFHRLDLLLNLLVERGYDFSTVSQLIDQAQ